MRSCALVSSGPIWTQIPTIATLANRSPGWPSPDDRLHANAITPTTEAARVLAVETDRPALGTLTIASGRMHKRRVRRRQPRWRWCSHAEAEGGRHPGINQKRKPADR
jgi:hypothetical protein